MQLRGVGEDSRANQETARRQLEQEPAEPAEIPNRPNHMRRWCYYACGLLWITGSVVGLVATVAIIIPVFYECGLPQTIGIFFVPGIGCTLITVFDLLPQLGRSLLKLVKSPGEAISDMRVAFAKWITRLLLSVAVSVFVLGLLYMDWCIGAVAGNNGGVPSRANSAIFWTWFALKRLGLFAA